MTLTLSQTTLKTKHKIPVQFLDLNSCEKFGKWHRNVIWRFCTYEISVGNFCGKFVRVSFGVLCMSNWWKIQNEYVTGVSCLVVSQVTESSQNTCGWTILQRYEQLIKKVAWRVGWGRSVHLHLDLGMDHGAIYSQLVFLRGDLRRLGG